MAAMFVIVFGGVALSFIVTFAIQFASFMASSLSKWGADVDAEVMAVIVAAILAFALTQYNAIRQSRNQLTYQADQQRRETYHNVVRHLSKSPFSPELLQLDPKQDATDTNNLASGIITCGSNDVIKAFRVWRVAKEEQDPHVAILAAGDLLLAIRRDLRLNNKNISNQDLMRCIMKGE
ncbi:MAG: hypothetical protein OXG60_11665 [Chloroflexi bacterium]|nr:hypothetical protein [Chloroflexota bacterium]